MPGLRVQDTSLPSPLESQPTTETQGVLASAHGALMGTLGVSLEAKAVGAVEGGPQIPYAEAAQAMKAQNYDPAVLPKGPINQGTLNAIMNQQSVIMREGNIAARSPGGGSGIARFVGGAADPLFLLGGPILGRGAEALNTAAEAVAGTGRAVGAAAGAAEGAATMGAYTKGEQQLGTAPGDRDISTADIMKSMALGGLIGGGVRAVLHSPVTTGDIDGLERSEAAAKEQGVSVNDVVSPAGAVGKFQIMPQTALELVHQIGHTGETLAGVTEKLHDPAFNEAMSKLLLKQLGKQFPNDPEAVAIAYNAGPRAANRWLAGGRDDTILPEETQGYLDRFRKARGITPDPEGMAADGNAGLPANVARDGLTKSLDQFLGDQQINPSAEIGESLDRQFSTSPLKIELEHLSEMRDLTRQASEAAFAPKGMFEGDPDIAQVARLIDMQPMADEARAPAASPAPAGGEPAATEVGPATAAMQPQLDAARQEAERMAVSVNPEGDPELQNLIDRHAEQDAQADENNRAVRAAASCGVNGGLE